VASSEWIKTAQLFVKVKVKMWKGNRGTMNEGTDEDQNQRKPPDERRSYRRSNGWRDGKMP
jgi:hypothetical protein